MTVGAYKPDVYVSKLLLFRLFPHMRALYFVIFFDIQTIWTYTGVKFWEGKTYLYLTRV